MAKTTTGRQEEQSSHERLDAQDAQSRNPIPHDGVQDIHSINTASAGIAIGALVMTLDGVLPVEFLAPGDKIVTRSGARALRRVSAREMTGEVISVCAGALGHDRPEQDLLLMPGTMVHLRDWRAQALFGRAQALVPAERLVDGEFVTRAQAARKVMFTLEFDLAEVIYVDGVELGVDALRLRG